MPRDLHPSLTAGPVPKIVCIGCHTTNGVLVPIPNSKTMHICLTCASLACANAHFEMLRSSMMALVDAAAPEVVL